MIDIKNICEIGRVFQSSQKIDYISNSTFLDFDAVVLSYRSYTAAGINAGILRNDPRTYIKEYFRRKGDLIDFLIHKKMPLVVFAPEFEAIQVYQTNIVELHEILPIGNFSVIDEKGKKCVALKNTIFYTFLEKYKDRFTYTSYFDKYKGIPILETPHTKKVLAYYNKDVLFLPKLVIKKDDEGEFLKDLFELLPLIRKSLVTEEELPDWTKAYLLPNENNLISKIDEKENQINLMQQKIVLQKEELIDLQKVKSLFIGTGNSLELKISKVFFDLGFEILETENNRDDLIIKYNDKIAVIEIKGVTGSAAEKHAAQLEKWVSLYYEEKEHKAKGILIVNAFKDTPLNERDTNTFPHQMLDFCRKREHCLISTIQLLGLFYKAKENEEEKERLINSLFDTVGVYDGFSDWKEFIEYSE